MADVVRTRLNNGITVLSEVQHAAPVVACQAWVGVGGADEEAHEAGLAHLHEHMLFKGTKRRGVGELARTIEASGGEINAWTSFDQTVYHVVVAASEAHTGLDVLSDALSASLFDPQELQRESEVVVEEILRAQDNPGRRLSQAMFSLAYARHPYRLPVLGTEQSVRGFNREGIVAFYRRHYRPDNVTVVAVGDFDTDTLLRQVDQTFGAWQPHGAAVAPLPTRPQEPPQTTLRVRMLREDVKEAGLALCWQGPSMADPELAAVDVLSTILGHGESSRLFDAARRRAGLVNDVQAYAYTPKDPGLIMVSAGMADADLARALPLLAAQTYALCHNPVSDAELHKAKTLILSEAAYARETVEGQARKLGFFEHCAGTYTFEAAYEAAVRRVDAAAVAAAARRFLTATPSLVAQVPQNGVASRLDEAALGDMVQQAHREAAAAPAPVMPHRAARSGPLGVHRLQLDNGAIILVRPEADASLINLRAVALGGQRWESLQTSGRSKLFAAVFGTATQSLGPQGLAARAANLAGSLAGFCGRNTVGLSGQFVAEHAPAALALFIEMLTAPAFLGQQLERERQVALENLRNRDDNPGLIAYDLFSSAIHPTHPYGLRQGGEEASLVGMTLADLAAFRENFLQPDKLVVSIVGGVDAAATLDAVAGALAGNRGEPLPPTPAPDPPNQAAQTRRRTLPRKQAHVIIGTLGTTLDDPDRYGLEVLSTVLSGQSGRLFVDLRDRQSLAYSISSSNLEGLDPGHFMVHVGTHPDKVGQACDGVYRHLEALQHEAVGEAELQRAQRYLIGNHAIELQRGGARAMLMALNERYGRPYDHHTEYAKRIGAVDAAALQRLARTYLHRDRLTQVVVGP